MRRSRELSFGAASPGQGYWQDGKHNGGRRFWNNPVDTAIQADWWYQRCVQHIKEELLSTTLSVISLTAGNIASSCRFPDCRQRLWQNCSTGARSQDESVEKAP